MMTASPSFSKVSQANCRVLAKTRHPSASGTRSLPGQTLVSSAIRICPAIVGCSFLFGVYLDYDAL